MRTLKECDSRNASYKIPCVVMITNNEMFKHLLESECYESPQRFNHTIFLNHALTCCFLNILVIDKSCTRLLHNCSLRARYIHVLNIGTSDTSVYVMAAIAR